MGRASTTRKDLITKFVTQRKKITGLSTLWLRHAISQNAGSGHSLCVGYYLRLRYKTGSMRIMNLISLFFLTISLLASRGSFAADNQKGTDLHSPQPTGSCEFALISVEFARQPIDRLNGLITDQVPMSVESLLAAYRRGIFPWGLSEQGAHWHSPDQRGVLEFSDMESRISNSDRKFLRKALAPGSQWTVTFDRAFSRVIQHCSDMPRFVIDNKTGERKLSGVWLSQEFINQYIALHRIGHAHSVEVWNEGKLVAGLYGVFVDGVFAGESMFHLVDADGKTLPESNNAAKLALFMLVERLKSNGHTFIDTQMAVGLSAKWGAKYVPRRQFLSMLEAAQAKKLKF